jgi:AcrR family transcriptional regulator
MPEHLAWRPQREAAARNEQRILDTARRLFAAADVDAVDVREIAKAARVGVGTVYRRFGDKAGLLEAVVNDDEKALQDQLLVGPPPLGPGAPARERLEAFLAALAELTEANLNVLLAVDIASGGRLRVGSYGAWRLHVKALLDELRPSPDNGWLADVLLAPLAADLYAFHTRRQGLSRERIIALTTGLMP